MRFLIVDDHPIMRVGVRQLILAEWPQAHIDEAASLAQALSLGQAQRPDAVVLDLSLPDASGTEGASRVLRALKAVPVLILSLNAESAYASRLLQMGVAGYLPKDRAGDDLVNALHRLLQGGRYVTAAMADHLLGLLDGRAPASLPHEQLSTQEHRVMLLIAAGKTPAEIADTMSLSVKTVGTYRARILEKAGWRNNTELTKYCLQHGLTV
ncbi:response regulator transcription factor [Paucibacter sp. O1-1]|uniref:response regulator n=1 Tax=Paucibacter sp. M5-1 TaxID=3015998 RepID=UPI0021D4A789|nr:response regulator transcription factor [Paucibacter sp. M5-1]MCU7373418.1 response regulator transcription factor [Paucibacter sp. O1-1]MCZ7879711.1 response regulator transcription factor [Paucibacter sp. M5-1]MDA3828418.1 response regulator transcription factor [Paucibacter sp. O1-1]